MNSPSRTHRKAGPRTVPMFGEVARSPAQERRYRPNAETLHLGGRVHAYYEAIHTAFYTGLRRGELLALRWCDIDLDMATASVSRTVYRARGGQQRHDRKLYSLAGKPGQNHNLRKGNGSSAVFDCIAEIVRQARVHSNMYILMVCRNFDLDNDHYERFQSLKLMY